MLALRLLSAVLALLSASAAAPPLTAFYGYTSASADRERSAETQFVDIPSAAGALDTATLLAVPHPAGSGADLKLATQLRDLFASLGFAASLETLTARIDTPKTIRLVLYPGGRTPSISAPGAEQGHGLFSRRAHKPVRHPAPHGHPALAAASPAPKPAGPVVAAAPAATPSARPIPPVALDLREPPIESDADTASSDIATPFLAGSADGDVTGPIVYAGFGGDLDYAALAAHGIDVHGAVAIIRDSGEFRGVTARRAQARGVAAVLFYDDPAEEGQNRGAAYPYGPYRPATAVRRGTVGEGITIPVLPVSAANAQTLLDAIHGPSAPAPWRGGLPASYAFARGPASVHLTVRLTRKPASLWNTIAVLNGTRPEESVILGAHRDAWVYGEGDDGSGIESLVEAARGIGYLAKNGWRPLHSIVLAAWDGEELGAYGSIAYVQRHGDEMQYGGIAYLDAEQTVTGPRFGADAAAAIGGAVADATHMVDDPAQPGASLFDRWGRFARALPPRFIEGTNDRAPSALFGLGIPSVNAGFSGAFGVYHSAYDTTTYASTYSDPTFALHRSAGQLYGVMAMRLADADVVPYRFAAYVPLLRGALRSFVATARGARRTVDTGGLGASLARFDAAAQRFDAATARVATDAATDRSLEAARVLDVVVYGNDGYAGVTLPEIAHAVVAADQPGIDRAVARTRAALDRATALLAP